MKVTIVGGGFVGHATGRGFAKHKHEVDFIDTSTERIAHLKKLGLSASSPQKYSHIISDVTMFCVPTPTKGQSIQLDYLKSAVSDFAKRLKNHQKYHVAVIRSTVPPKTTREIIIPIIETISGKKAGRDFGISMQPEYLREKTATDDFERPWFVLIGELDKKSGDSLEILYRSFDAPIERCSLEEAEMQKYVHNLYNAVKIAFFNEMRIVFKREGWNADSMFRATAESCEGIWNPTYGIKDFGPFDGSCLPKDTRAFLEWGDSNGYDLGILRAVIAENIKHEKILGKNETVRVNHLASITI